MPANSTLKDKSDARGRKDSGDEVTQSEDGEYYDLQYPIIKMIEDYMVMHPVDGKKMTVKLFAEKAGIPLPNLFGVMNGHRWLARSSRELIQKLSDILEIPVFQIYTMCGFITAQDIVPTQSLDKVLDVVYDAMIVDQSVTYRVPGRKAWASWPQDAKLCLVMMYEAYLGKRLQQYASVHVK
jgi:hypothetical protein